MHNNFSIIWGTRQLRQPQVALYIACAMKQLKAQGVKPLDRVAVCDENSVEYVVLLLALWQMKAVAAPVNPRWPDKTISAYVAKINARHLLRGGDIKRIVCFDARYQIEAEKMKPFDPEQEVTIIATSGSSGESKAALHSWGNHFYSAQGSRELIALEPQDRWLLSLPLYHISGIAILVRCLLSGAGLVLLSDDNLMTAMERGRVTHVSLVATQLHRLLEDSHNHAVLRSLKCILLGGSAIPKKLIERAADLGLNVYLSYGLTEMSSQVATGKVIGGQCCVKVLPHRQLDISPQGEILVRGEVLFKGYITGTRLPIPPMQKSWFVTGDMGRLGADGGLTVTGRRDSMFISGGENIHPEEIEKALLNIKGITQAIVVPKEDEEFGHRPIAFIQFEDKPLKETDMVRSLEADLPRFKIPTAFLPWPKHLMEQGIKISRQEFLKSLPRR